MSCVEPLRFYDILKANMDKKPDRPPLRVVIKYILLQFPGQATFILILVLIRQWLETPTYLTWGLLGFWVGKDIFYSPFSGGFMTRTSIPTDFG